MDEYKGGDWVGSALSLTFPYQATQVQSEVAVERRPTSGNTSRALKGVDGLGEFRAAIGGQADCWPGGVRSTRSSSFWFLVVPRGSTLLD